MWALFTYVIGATILKTEDTEADWGQLARGTGFAQTPGILHVFYFIPALFYSWHKGATIQALAVVIINFIVIGLVATAAEAA